MHGKPERFEDPVVCEGASASVSDLPPDRRLSSEEKFGLVSQMRRAAVPAPANITEGFKKLSGSDKAYFHNIARGSLEELRYYLILARDIEPLRGPIEALPLDGIHWVIVGSESGPGARPMDVDWVHSLRRQCKALDVSFFFKQWGGVRKDLTGRELDGRVYEAFPEPANVAQQAASLSSWHLSRNVKCGRSIRNQ
ncbi:MAG: DUF5131 family protein [candidate division WOR-3 bacterium]